jgi:hypothetical protein
MSVVRVEESIMFCSPESLQAPSCVSQRDTQPESALSMVYSMHSHSKALGTSA